MIHRSLGLTLAIVLTAGTAMAQTGNDWPAGQRARVRLLSDTTSSRGTPPWQFGVVNRWSTDSLWLEVGDAPIARPLEAIDRFEVEAGTKTNEKVWAVGGGLVGVLVGALSGVESGPGHGLLIGAAAGGLAGMLSRSDKWMRVELSEMRTWDAARGHRVAAAADTGSADPRPAEPTVVQDADAGERRAMGGPAVPPTGNVWPVGQWARLRLVSDAAIQTLGAAWVWTGTLRHFSRDSLWLDMEGQMVGFDLASIERLEVLQGARADSSASSVARGTNDTKGSLTLIGGILGAAVGLATFAAKEPYPDSGPFAFISPQEMWVMMAVGVASAGAITGALIGHFAERSRPSERWQRVDPNALRNWAVSITATPRRVGLTLRF